MAYITSAFTYIFDCIGAVFTWFADLLNNSGLPVPGFLAIICALIALDFFVTFIRMQSVGAMMSDSSATITAREGKILGVKGFHVKR